MLWYAHSTGSSGEVLASGIMEAHTTAEHTKSTQSQQSLSAPLLLLLMLHAKCFAQTAYMAMIY